MGRKAIMKVALMDSISKIACTKTITPAAEKMMTIHLIFQFSCKDWIILRWDLKGGIFKEGKKGLKNSIKTHKRGRLA